jgi:hypothetical protein
MATNTSNVLNFGKTLSVTQAAQLIMAVPDNIFMIKGEMGVGKSSILNFLREKLSATHIVAPPIDVPNLDLGDTAMPVVDKELMLTNYAPNARFQLTQGKPVVLCLDEFTKGAEPVKNMLHPLFETTNRRLGDVFLHPGSIVFLTGNLGQEGVGDNLKAHSKNRITEIHVRKPTSDEWLTWAQNNHSNPIDPVVMAWVRDYPHCLASFLDGDQDGNPYINNPKKIQGACVSPRSLERASNIVKAREGFDTDSLIAALAGTVGESAARDMEAYITFQDQLPQWATIVEHPKMANVPTDPGACAVLIFGAIQKITKETMPAFMEYLLRFSPEWQAAFAINVAKNPSKQSIAFSSTAFARWLQQNEDLL